MGRRLMLGVLFGVVVYAGIVLWADQDRILEALEDFPIYLIPLALALSFANYVIRFLKWERYRRLLAIDLDRKTSFLVYLAGFSMGVTPGKMGEVFKSWLIRKVNGTPISYSAPIVVAERYTDLLGYLILVAIGGLATLPKYQWVFWTTLALCGVALVLVGSEGFARLVTRGVAKAPFVWRLAPKVERSFESTRVLLAPKQLFFPTAISVVSWGCECTAFWLIADALSVGDLSFLFAVFAYAFSAVAGAVLIVFPGGLGVTEYAGGTLLRREYMRIDPGLVQDAAQANAASAVLLTRLCTLWFAVAVGLLATAVFRSRFGQVDES
jgi:uncharacterized protein (TIRG00374 family)